MFFFSAWCANSIILMYEDHGRQNSVGKKTPLFMISWDRVSRVACYMLDDKEIRSHVLFIIVAVRTPVTCSQLNHNWCRYWINIYYIILTKLLAYRALLCLAYYNIPYVYCPYICIYIWINVYIYVCVYFNNEIESIKGIQKRKNGIYHRWYFHIL